MNIKNLTISMLAATAMLAGCNKPAEEPALPSKADYKGTVSVEYQGAVNDNEDIRVNFEASEDGATASITIYKIRFVPQMPVTVDVTSPDVQLTQSGDEILLTCDEVVPLSMGGPVERYKVTGLKGKQKGDELNFSLNFGSFPTSFTGVLTVFTEE